MMLKNVDACKCMEHGERKCFDEQNSPILLGQREIVEKYGEDLDDIFYVRSYVSIWKIAENLFQIKAYQSGVGRNYFSSVFDSFEAAHKAYDIAKGVLAHSRAERMVA